MSLTSILNYGNKSHKNFRNSLSKHFPTPKFICPNPIQVELGTKNYMLIGTAFDYLLRFCLEKENKDKTFGRIWEAEIGLDKLKRSVNSIPIQMLDKLDGKSLREFQAQRKIYNETIANKFAWSKSIYDQFIKSDQIKFDNLFKAVLFLARLEDASRRAKLNEIYIGEEDNIDIRELQKLIGVCNLESLKPKNKLILNPTFGEGSKLVRGADADLIIDDTLIDIKVTKDAVLTRPYYNQLIGYYLLYLIGGVDGHKEIKIKNLGIYFVRYNFLWTISVYRIGRRELFENAIEVLKKSSK